VKRAILVGVVGVIVLTCLLSPGAPCGNGFACLAATATHPMEVVFAAVVVLALALVAMVRTGWTALLLSRSLRELPTRSRPELEQQGVVCLTSVAPTAFCAGALRPRVYVTDSLVDLLQPSSLAAVIAHEQAHARRRDPLRRSILAALSLTAFDAPWVRWLRSHHSEHAEISADRAAARRVGAGAVADALRTLAGDGSGAQEAGPDSKSEPGRRPILVSALATLVVALMLPCALQAALLIGGGHLPVL